MVAVIVRLVIGRGTVTRGLARVEQRRLHCPMITKAYLRQYARLTPAAVGTERIKVVGVVRDVKASGGKAVAYLGANTEGDLGTRGTCQD